MCVETCILPKPSVYNLSQSESEAVFVYIIFVISFPVQANVIYDVCVRM